MLALLGEPGAGKSTAVRQLPAEPDGSVCSREVLDLDTYASASELAVALRDSSSRVAEGEIVLDGVDESRVAALGATLERWLASDCPPSCRVRVAMRTSTLTPSLEEHLSAGAAQRGTTLETWVLAPLRERDVAEAARVLGFEAGAFNREIHRVGASHFAVLAGRLAAMARGFARDGRLADTLWEMYETEVRALVDTERAAVGPAYLRSGLGLNDAVRLLSRIAAVSLLSGRSTLWIDRDQDAPRHALRIGDFVDPSERESWEDGVVAYEPEIARALKVGPFRAGSSAGEIAWSQRPIAEFLAARYLLDREIPLDQVRQLILDTDTGRVPPQLHGLAAMLCSKPGSSSPIVELVSERDPHVAIRGDLLSMPEEDRQRVAERLLCLAVEGGLTYAEFHARGLLHRLANPRLADALRPTLLDRGADEFVRELATDIAEECLAESLAEDLAKVALDGGDDLRVRISAAYALSKFPRAEDRLRLLPALEREDPGDPDHDVRGCALRGLWPGLIPLSEVLAALVPPTHRLNYGYYASFVADLLGTVGDVNVPELLRWARALPEGQLDRTLGEVVDGLLERGARLADDSSVRKELVPLMRRFSRRRNAGAGWAWLRENALGFETRFALAAALHTRTRKDDWAVSSIAMGERGLIRPDDFVALLDVAIARPRDRAAALALARGVGRLYLFADDSGHVQAVLERRGANPEFDATFRDVWEPWPIRGEIADRIRADYARAQKRLRKEAVPTRRKGVPAPRPKCRRLLKAFEGGDRGAYWKLMEWLPLDGCGGEVRAGPTSTSGSSRDGRRRTRASGIV